MFGGWDGGHYHNDTYLLDIETWVRVYTHTCNRHNTVVLLVLVYTSADSVQCTCTIMCIHLPTLDMYVHYIILIVTCHATYNNYSCNVHGF